MSQNPTDNPDNSENPPLDYDLEGAQMDDRFYGSTAGTTALAVQEARALVDETRSATRLQKRVIYISIGTLVVSTVMAIATAALAVATVRANGLARRNVDATLTMLDRQSKPQMLSYVGITAVDTLGDGRLGSLTYEWYSTNVGQGMANWCIAGSATGDSLAFISDTTGLGFGSHPMAPVPPTCSLWTGNTRTYDIATARRHNDVVYLHLCVVYGGGIAGATYYSEQVFYVHPLALAREMPSRERTRSYGYSDCMYGKLVNGRVVPDH